MKSAGKIQEFLPEQLKQLQVDYVDLYLIRAVACFCRRVLRP
jgi:predicted aldo/keto reductase-like oxidoreductase